MGNVSKKLVGVGFILVAIGYIMSEMGYLAGFNFTTVILGIAFAAGAVAGALDKRVNQVIFCIGLFYYVTQEALSLPELSLWVVLVSCTLIGLGWALLFEKKKPINRTNTYTNQTKDASQETSPGYDRVSVFFGESEKFINTKRFEYLSSNVIFGTAKIYFDESQMLNNTAKVDVNVIFGDTTLFVPKNWEVDVKVVPVFGECSIRGHQGTFDKHLVVNGSVIFGELQVIYI
ncbi:MAG: LiaF-related protein [Eubacteriales bacterium]